MAESIIAPAIDEASPIPRRALAGVMMMTLIAGVITSLQPMLLGLVAAQGRLTMSQIGQAATFEALGMALASSMAGLWLRPEHLKQIALLATAMLLAANIVSMSTTGSAIIGARMVAGLSSGLIIWIYVGLLARVPTPARTAGILSVAQGVLALSLTSLLSTVLVPAFGGGAGYGALVVITVMMGAALPLMPSRYYRIVKEGMSGIPTGRGLLGLFAVFLQHAGIIGTWVYALPLAREAGLTDVGGGLAISLAIGCQIIGGLSAAVLATRFNPAAMLLLGLCGGPAALALMVQVDQPTAFAIGVGLFGFLWMGTTAFQMPFLIAADPSRRAAMQLVAAQLLGISAGPAIAALLVTPESAQGAALMSGVLFFAGALVVLLVHWAGPGKGLTPDA